MVSPSPSLLLAAENAGSKEGNSNYVTAPINKGRYPLFGTLTGLYEKLSTETKHELRRKLLANWFRKWREEVGPDLYPVLRLLLPQKDRERAVYNIKEKVLAKIYIRMIPLNPKDDDAVRLLNWKKPSEKDKAAGDFPMVLYDVVSKRSNVTEGSLDIEKLNNLLDELSKAGGKMEQQTTIMTTIYNRCTPGEQRWIVRIILKDLIISVKETTVLSVFHPDAMALFNTCSDLKRVAYELHDPARRLDDDEKTIKLFRAFAPMLCKRPTKRIEDTVKLMGGEKFIIEEKLDGERMQLHKRGNEYFYCSRKGKDYTYLYGKTVGEGSLTPYIDRAFDPRVDSIVLDGEMLVWDPVAGRHLPFGSLKTAALDKSKAELRPRPCFKIFDVLFLNGQSLINKTLVTRKKNMRAYVSEVQGHMEYTQEFEGKTAKDVRTKMDEIMENRGEGLILKHPKGAYTLNGRNVDFIKVKPEYLDNMGETVDVLVVAGNWGSGKRGGGVSTLICAVRDDREDAVDHEDEMKYSTFVRIGSGLSFADYVWIREKPWKPWIKDDPPSFLQTSRKGAEDKGDVYLSPEDSFIIKVKAAEIVTSDQYHLNLTMRFPRAISIRDDLSADDCLTATDLFESLSTEKKRKTSDIGGVQKRRRGNTRKIIALPQHQGADVKGVNIQSSLLEGLKFRVIADPKSKSAKLDKNELEKLIHSHGGDYSQLTKNDTSMVVYDGDTTPPVITSIIKGAELDIIRSGWIKDSIAAGQRRPFRKKYFFHATTPRQLDADYDEVESDVDEDAQRGNDDDTAHVLIVVQESSPLVEEGLHSEWFDISGVDEGDQHSSIPPLPWEEERLEYDSDNVDMTEDDIELPDTEYLVIESGKASDKGVTPASDASEQTGVRMGDGSAMEYDQEAIFRHLRFYLDTADNARKHGFQVEANRKWTSEIETNFQEVATIITHNGGEIVDLDDPGLTHVLYDKRDESRRVQLMRRTSKPKRRHVVMTDFVTSSIGEGTLLDEDVFS